MANFDPTTARCTAIYVRRRDPVQPGGQQGSYPGFVLDELKYYRVRYDTDQPGEHPAFYEPVSDANFSLQTGGGAASSGLDISPAWYPVENIEVWDNPSEVMRID